MEKARGVAGQREVFKHRMCCPLEIGSDFCPSMWNVGASSIQVQISFVPKVSKERSEEASLPTAKLVLLP